MELNIDIRRARKSDLETVAELSRSSFKAAFAAVNTPEDMNSYLQQAFAPEVMADEFSDMNSCFILAECGQELAGYKVLRDMAGVGFVGLNQNTLRILRNCLIM